MDNNGTICSASSGSAFLIKINIPPNLYPFSLNWTKKASN